jgi:hypothetical protein
LGTFRVGLQGQLEPIPDSNIELNNSYHKLVLLSDGCHIVAMEENLNNSENGTLVLYRIDDPAIGCAPAKDKLLIEILPASSAGLLCTVVVSGIVAFYLYYWLKKKGAKKGYIPIGNPEF